jgi:hypothetical protein
MKVKIKNRKETIINLTINMKLVTTILSLLSIIILFGQERVATKDEYLFAKEVFKKQYKKEIYERYTGQIVQVDEKTIKFNEEVLLVGSVPEIYKAIFLNGIFYPEIIVGYPDATVVSEEEYINPLFRSDSLRIGHFIELKKLNPNPQTKRFLFWVFFKHRMNPNEYFIELENKGATKKTSTADFMKNARLTFYYRGGVII